MRESPPEVFLPRLTKTAVALLLPVLFACSTTYSVAPADLDKLRAGAQISAVNDPSGETVDLTHYAFDYHLPDKAPAVRARGIESINHTSEAGGLANATAINIVPQFEDKPWQRIGLGAGIGLVTGFGIGYAVSNRIVIERQGQDGAACHDCSIGTTLLGSFVSAALGLVAGGVISYFAGSGLGETKTAVLSYFAPAASEPVSQPAP